MSADATVTALVNHMNAIETRRRLLMMRVKEAETRLTHLEDDGASAAKEETALVEKEAATRTRLTQLHEEQRVLAVHLSDGSGQLRKSETEEPFLLGNATEQRKMAATQLVNWKAQLVRLEEVKGAWSGNTLTGPLLDAIEKTDTSIAALVAEEKAIVESIATAMVANSANAAAATVVNGSAVNGNCSSPRLSSAVDNRPDTPRCRQQIANLTRLIAEEETASARISNGAQREVDSLHEREAELQKWVNAAKEKAHIAQRLTAQLQASLNARMCRGCQPPCDEE